MKEKVGQVTTAERDEIKKLFERRNGLQELAKVLTVDNDALYQKLVTDLGETNTRFQNWWDQKSAQYNWKSSPNGKWEIQFDTCEIFLSQD